MILAKFSGIGSTTATSRVSSADSRSGAITSATSRTRRNRLRRMMAIARRHNRGRRKAPTIVSLVASMVTADPPASGATAETCPTNCRNPAGFCAAFGGVHLHSRPTIRQDQSAPNSCAIRGKGDRFRAQRLAQPVELLGQEAGQRDIGGLQHVVRRGLHAAQSSATIAERMVLRQFPQRRADLRQGRLGSHPYLLWCSRSGRRLRGQGRRQNGVRVLDHGKLLLLVGWHEAVDADDPGDGRQGGQLVTNHRRRRCIRRQNVDVYGLVSGLLIRSRKVRIASVFGFFVSNGSESNTRNGDDATAATARIAKIARIGRRRRATHRVQARRPGKSNFPRFATRPAQRDRGRQETQGAYECHDHPAAGDQPKLRDAGEIRRHEGKNPAAVASAAIRIWTPTRRAVSVMAVAASRSEIRYSR